MTPEAAGALCVVGSYLLGAIPFALLAGRLRGIDLRQHGSGNVGATNALRVLGKRMGLTVLLLDLAKGALPVLLAPRLLAHLGHAAPGWLAPALAAAAILGHVFPLYLRFQGGKGVATAAGAFLALHPAALGIAALAFGLVLGASRIVSLSSLVAAATLPVAAIALDGWATASGPHAGRTAMFVAMAALVWVRHRKNLARLLEGEEPRLGQKAPAEPAQNHPT
ncbi:MAG: glycerol-3-phosphate 1-O-acyltransferase PlsY [Planctomycetota bacterium]